MAKGGKKPRIGFMGPISGAQFNLYEINQCRVQMSDT